MKAEMEQKQIPDGGHKECDIEHHAVLYALLVKEAVRQAGQEGRLAMREATAAYGLRRGERMRQRALKNGDGTDPVVYMAYCEWSAAPGTMVAEEIEELPCYRVQTVRCEWCRSWEKHGLMPYGKAYCENVDVNLIHGFNPQFDLDIEARMSAGAERCDFIYRFPMTPENRAKMETVKQRIGTSEKRDFNYLTADLYFSCRSTLIQKLGETLGNHIAETALADFTSRFGNGYTDAVMEYEGCDFS